MTDSQPLPPISSPVDRLEEVVSPRETNIQFTTSDFRESNLVLTEQPSLTNNSEDLLTLSKNDSRPQSALSITEQFK